MSLVSGSGGAPWIADTGNPVIHLSWHGQRRIASLIVAPAASGASTPLTVKITSPDGTRQADIGFGGLVTFNRPLVTDRIDVSFPHVQQASVVNATGQLTTLPLGLSRLSVPALAKLRVVAPDEQARFTLACGQGPALSIDGRAHPTSVSGTIGELSQFFPLRVRLCTPGGALAFGAGRHTLTAATPGTFAVTDLSMTGGDVTPGPASARSVTIRSWQPDQRRLGVGPGAVSFLEVHENYNQGWTATLGGRELAPVRLDGWQQGFVLPAGLRRHGHAELPAGRFVSPRPGGLAGRHHPPARPHGLVIPQPAQQILARRLVGRPRAVPRSRFPPAPGVPGWACSP